MKRKIPLDQSKTPLWTAHKKYMEKNVLRMDVPGHKAGKWASPMANYLDQVFRYDINSCKEIDNLAHPQSVIDDAHALFAKAFGASQAHFLINGTTQGIHAMLLATLKPGDTILIPDNVHKSTINGIILLGLRVGFIKPEFSREWGIANNVTLSSIEKAYVKYPQAKAVLVLNPTYFGIVSNLKEIVKWCKAKDLYLFADEAHGSHFHFHKKMPYSAMEAGADMAAMSIHKTSGSLTQSSALLWNSKLVYNERVFRAVNVLQTTSPNYLLMSSLDSARYHLFHNGKDEIEKVIELASYAREKIKKIEGVDIIDETFVKKSKGVFALDPTKLIIKLDKLGLSGFEVYEILRTKYKIQAELGEFKVILCVVTPADDTKTINRLVFAIKDLAKKKKEAMTEEMKMLHHNMYVEREMVYTIRESFFMEIEEIDWKNAEGRVSGDTFMTYPPGISLLLPGQRITKKHIQYQKWLVKKGASITSNASTTDRIIVIKEKDEK